MARVMTSGMVKTQHMSLCKEAKWTIRSQVLRLSRDMDAVHRLDVGGRGKKSSNEKPNLGVSETDFELLLGALTTTTKTLA